MLGESGKAMPFCVTKSQHFGSIFKDNSQHSNFSGGMFKWDLRVSAKLDLADSLPCCVAELQSCLWIWVFIHKPQRATWNQGNISVAVALESILRNDCGQSPSWNWLFRRLLWSEQRWRIYLPSLASLKATLVLGMSELVDFSLECLGSLGSSPQFSSSVFSSLPFILWMRRAFSFTQTLRVSR